MTTKPRNAAKELTLPLPGVSRPVGRPRKPDALTPAQRQARYRKNKKVSVTSNGNSPIDLPGMWDVSDFSGGATDCERNSVMSNEKSEVISLVALSSAEFVGELRFAADLASDQSTGYCINPSVLRESARRIEALERRLQEISK